MLVRFRARRSVRAARLVSLVPAPAGLTVTGSGFGDEPAVTVPVLAIGLDARGRSLVLVAAPAPLDFGTASLVVAGSIFDTYEING